MLYQLLFSFLLVSASSLTAMEQEHKDFVIKDTEGTLFTISEDEASLFGVMKKWNETSDDMYDEEGGTYFSLPNASFFTQHNIELLISLVKSKGLEDCNKEVIKPIFLLADALEAPEVTIKELSEQAWNIVPLQEIDEEIPGVYEYLTSIATILHESAGFSWEKLSFAGKQLCSLQGIKEFSNEMTVSLNLKNNRLRAIDIKEILTIFPHLIKLDLCNNQLEHIEPEYVPTSLNLDLAYNKLTELPNLDPSTKTINLHHNCIKTLNIKDLLTKYPNVTELDLSHNELEKVKFPKQFPDFFVLNLSYNNLTEIPPFKVKEGCVINLSHNPLSVNAKSLALSAPRGNYSKPFKQLYRFIFPFSLQQYLTMLACSEGICGPVVAVPAWRKTLPTLVYIGRLYQWKEVQPLPSYEPQRNIFGMVDFFNSFKWPPRVLVQVCKDQYQKIPSETTFYQAIKESKTYIVGGLALGLLSAWGAAAYCYHDSSKQYKDSKIIVD